MGGKVVAVWAGFLADSPDGPQRVTIDLAAMARHCRDLTLLCEDVLRAHTHSA